MYTKSRLKGWEIPNHPILGAAFRLLCILGTSRNDLTHWQYTESIDWKEHVKVMVSRFHYSNVTAGLVLTTTAVLISSDAPLTSLMDYNTPTSYIFALAAFGAALLSVISGAIVLVIYETSVTHKDMTTLKDMSRLKVVCLLLWLSWPSICLAVATFCLYLSVFIACFHTSSIIIKVLASLSLLFFLVNGVLAVSVTIYVGKPVSPIPQRR